ncbi:CHAT domain-containing protein [Oxynema sp. CENA135]|uniref:CHAT domain-containing protein n=1 Tax=Oxynema sp. CENA135 TaxID=984206 RepID=UPI00190D65D0|nr:CHAT domain-containing protein [Oxynema sp. CENA135]
MIDLRSLPRSVRSFIRLAVLSGLLVAIALPAAVRPLQARGVQPAGTVEIPTAEVESNPLQAGRRLYDAGRVFEATQIWESAARDYAARGDRLNHALSQNYLGVAYQQLGAWERSRSAIDTSLDAIGAETQLDRRGSAILAQALNTLGNWQLARGQTEEALETWRQAQSAYERAENQTGIIGSQINQAQALQALGQYRHARARLEELVERVGGQPDSPLKADALHSLGIALQMTGELERSKAALESSWAIAERLGDRATLSKSLLGIGNIARDLDRDEVARAYYREAAKQAPDELTIVQARLNELNLNVRTQRWAEAIALVPEIESRLANLSPSRPSIYARVNLAAHWLQIDQRQPQTAARTQIAELLATAIAQAQDIRDERAQAHARYQLGQLYERNGQLEQARHLTEQALTLADPLEAEDIEARAAWQLGRLLVREGRRDLAIAAYQNAFETLQTLRADLVSVNTDVQFNFQESVEPLYREFVSLLLAPDAPQDQIVRAREVMEALQLAELDNFFRDSCLETKPTQIDRIDPEAAAIYPIVLADRLEVIVSIPNRPLTHYATAASRDRVEQTLQQLYTSLFLGYSGNERLQWSRQVYDWLIRPAVDELDAAGIKTLVFVLDGWFRNLPMGALYDGQQYLVERYGVALSPGLQLFPEGLKRSDLSVLAVGLTEARQGFSALPGVEREVRQLEADLKSEVLLDRQFTRENFQQWVNAKSFRVVHLATHGQFSSRPEETFLLTWNDRIDVKAFERLLENREQAEFYPIDLLVLSACQTASGDKRATLGLAGFALRSGARSTLATLWSVSDRSTAELMGYFYDFLSREDLKLSKAEALRRAQLRLIQDPQYNHPYFWAPFVLVGNWL